MSLPAVVASGFAFVACGLIALPFLLGFLAGLRPSGDRMTATRTRTWAGLAVLALAALVAGIGWYRISGEPLLNRQIPFLASAGLLVVVLSVLGGSLLISEQLRGDQTRISELENAVRDLTEALAPMIELPQRASGDEVRPAGRARSGGARST